MVAITPLLLTATAVLAAAQGRDASGCATPSKADFNAMVQANIDADKTTFVRFYLKG